MGLTAVRQAVVCSSECTQHMLPAGLFSLLGHSNLVTLDTAVALTPESRDQAEVCSGYSYQSFIHISFMVKKNRNTRRNNCNANSNPQINTNNVKMITKLTKKLFRGWIVIVIYQAILWPCATFSLLNQLTEKYIIIKLIDNENNDCVALLY